MGKKKGKKNRGGFDDDDDFRGYDNSKKNKKARNRNSYDEDVYNDDYDYSSSGEDDYDEESIDYSSGGEDDWGDGEDYEDDDFDDDESVEDEEEEDEEEEEEDSPSELSTFSVASNNSRESHNYGNGAASSNLTPRQAVTQSMSSNVNTQGGKPSSLSSLRPVQAVSSSSGRLETVSSNDFKPVQASVSPTSQSFGLKNSTARPAVPTSKKEDLKMQDSPDDEVVDWSRAKQKGALNQSSEDEIDEKEELRLERISELEEEIAEVQKKIAENDELSKTPDISQDELDKLEMERAEQEEQLARLKKELSGLTSNFLQKVMAPLADLGRLPSSLKARAVSFWEARRAKKNDDEPEDYGSKHNADSKSDKGTLSSKELRQSRDNEEDDEDEPMDDDRYTQPARNWQRIVKRTGIVTSVTTLALVIATIGYRFFSGKSSVSDDNGKVASAESVNSKEKDLWSRLSSKKDDVKKSPVETKGKVQNKLSSTTSSVVDKFSEALDSSVEESKAAFDSFSEDILEETNNIKEEFANSSVENPDSADSVDNLMKGISEFAEDAQNKVDDLYGQTAQSAEDVLDATADSISDVSNSISDSVSDVADSIDEYATATVDGMHTPTSTGGGEIADITDSETIDPKEGAFEFGSTPARNATAQTEIEPVDVVDPPLIAEEVATPNVENIGMNQDGSEFAAISPESTPADDLSADPYGSSNASLEMNEINLTSDDGVSNWTSADSSEGNSLASSAYATPTEPLENGTYAAQVEQLGDASELTPRSSTSAGLSSSNLGLSDETQLSEPTSVDSLTSASNLNDSGSLGNSVTLDAPSITPIPNDDVAGIESSSLSSNLSSLGSAPSSTTAPSVDSGQDYSLTLDGASNALLEVDENADLNALSGANTDNWANNGSLDQLNALSQQNSTPNGVESLSSQLTDNINELKNQASNALNSFNEKVDGVSARVADTTNRWQSDAQQGLDSLNQALNEGASSIQGLADDFNTSVSNLGGGLSDAWDQSVANVQQEANNLSNSLANAYDSTVGSLQQVGENISSNLQNLQDSIAGVNPLNAQGASNNALPLDASLNATPALGTETSLNQNPPLSSLGTVANATAQNPAPTQLNQPFSNAVLDSSEIDATTLSSTSLDSEPMLSTTTNPALPASTNNATIGLAPTATSSPATASLQPTGVNATPVSTANLANSATANPAISTPTGTSTNVQAATVIAPPASTTMNSNIQSSLASPPSYAMSPLGRYSNARVNSNELSTPNVSFATPSSTMPSSSGSTPITVALPTPVASNAVGGATSSASQIQTGFREYITKEGDNLLTIAENELGNSSRWGEIKRLNNLPYGSTYFDVGTKLKIPTR